MRCEKRLMMKGIELPNQEKNPNTQRKGKLQVLRNIGCPPCKILKTILKVDEGITSTNELENKKTQNDA